MLCFSGLGVVDGWDATASASLLSCDGIGPHSMILLLCWGWHACQTQRCSSVGFCAASRQEALLSVPQCWPWIHPRVGDPQGVIHFTPQFGSMSGLCWSGHSFPEVPGHWGLRTPLVLGQLWGCSRPQCHTAPCSPRVFASGKCSASCRCLCSAFGWCRSAHSVQDCLKASSRPCRFLRALVLFQAIPPSSLVSSYLSG